MIKIVGIVGSPHKNGMTTQLAQRALAGALAEGAEVSLLHLAEEKLTPCRGCGGGCWESLACVSDEMATARAADLQDAAGIVMAVPVYCWQLSGLTSLFTDKMRWDTRSVLQHRNARAALGIACAGGSGTGCVLALQHLYRYFYNWSFHGLHPLPVTRYNFAAALDEAEAGGRELVQRLRAGIAPFPSMGEAMLDYEALPYMGYQPLDELRLIVDQICRGLEDSAMEGTEVGAVLAAAQRGRAALLAGDRLEAARSLDQAYFAGRELWARR